MMDDRNERRCCRSIGEIEGKLGEAQNVDNSQPKCITEHPGFGTVCLDVWVLQTAWMQYVNQYGRNAYEGRPAEKFRHIAYRQLQRWCWGFLGRSVRVVLPSCAVCRIRDTFPSADGYTGFRYSALQ
jgi:hypothetical protein